MERQKAHCPNPQCTSREIEEDVHYCPRCGTPMLLDGKYRLIRMLGQGGMGRTFLARDQRFADTPNERCVVKELKTEFLDEERAEKLLRREASRLLELRHENIPSFRDFFEISFDNEGRGWYLVQQFIDGEDLDAKLMREGALPLSRVMPWMSELLLLLRYLHEQVDHETGKPTPVLHLDIKPQNIMIRHTDGRLYLIDFGVATQLQMTQLQTHGAKASVRGYTPGFAPFEQTMGFVAPGSDIYSWAMTFLSLATAKSSQMLMDPFGGGLKFRDYIELSNPLTKLLDQCLQLQLRDRAKSAKEVLLQWQQTPEYKQYVVESLADTVSPSEPAEEIPPFQSVLQGLPSAVGWTEESAAIQAISAAPVHAQSTAEATSQTSLPASSSSPASAKNTPSPKAKASQPNASMWAGLGIVALCLLTILYVATRKNPPPTPRHMQPSHLPTQSTHPPQTPPVVTEEKVVAQDAGVGMNPRPPLALATPPPQPAVQLTRRPPPRRTRRRSISSPSVIPATTPEGCVRNAKGLSSTLQQQFHVFLQSPPTPESWGAYKDLLLIKHSEKTTLPIVLCLHQFDLRHPLNERIFILIRVWGFRQPSRVVLRTLLNGLGHPRGSIRIEASRGLIKLRARSVPYITRELQRYAKLPINRHQDNKLYMLLRVCIELGHLLKRDAIGALERMAPRMRNGQILHLIFQALGSTRSLEVLPFLLSSLEHNSRFYYYSILGSIGKIGPKARQAIPRLLRWQSDSQLSSSQREELRITLMHLEPKKVRAVAQKLLHRDAKSQKTALKTLIRIRERAGWAIPQFKSLLASQPSEEIRILASDLLESMLNAPFLEPNVPKSKLYTLLSTIACRNSSKRVREYAATRYGYLRRHLYKKMPPLPCRPPSP